MEDYILEGYLNNLAKNKSKEPLKGLSVEPINLEHYKVTQIGDGMMNDVRLYELYKWAEDSLRMAAHALDFIIKYSPESPRYWLKDIKARERGYYEIALNLERFMQSKKAKEFEGKDVPFYIPDNYELARKVFADFKKHTKLNRYTIVDNSYRELACWRSKDLNELKSLAKYITETYIEPELKLILERTNIKKCIFSKTQVDFEYDDTRSN